MTLQEYIDNKFQTNKHLQVLFLFDKSKEREAEVQAIIDAGEIAVRVCQNDWLSQKLWVQDLEIGQPAVLYYPELDSPVSVGAREAFPMLGLLLANAEIKIDQVADLMQEFHIQTKDESLIRRYVPELKLVTIKKLVTPILLEDVIDYKALALRIISGVLGAKKPEEESDIAMRLVNLSTSDFKETWDKIYARLEQVELLDSLNHLVKQYFDMELKTGDHSELAELAYRVKYNMITQGMDVSDKDPYKEFKITGTDVLFNLERIFRKCTHKDNVAKYFRQAMNIHGVKIQEHRIVETYGVHTQYTHYNTALRLALLQRIVQTYMETREDITSDLSLMANKQDVNEGLYHITLFLLRFLELTRGIQSYRSFHQDSPIAHITRYCRAGKDQMSYARMDFLYRKALWHYTKRDDIDGEDELHGSDQLNENLDSLKQQMDADYARMVFNQNLAWTQSLNDVQFDYLELQGVDKQRDFYENYVAPRKHKIAVIISDGLRYEVAQELVEVLHGIDAKYEATLNHQLASIPSTTSFGMANLLPMSKCAYQKDASGKGRILLDSIQPKDLSSREQILQQRNPHSRAVKAETILKNNKTNNLELFKADVVYIYHDKIDSLAHKGGHESEVLNASEETLLEIKKLVQKILSANVTQVIITADHGFLYREEEIAEKDKNEIRLTNKVELGARHAITEDQVGASDQGYMFPLKNTTNYKEAFTVFTPKSVNRLKAPGVTYKYTHGGASLQELIVPVITTSRKGTRKVKKVDIMLLTKNLRVSSNILKLECLQNDAVSDTHQGRTLTFALYENDVLVTKVKEYAAQFAGETAQERVFPVKLILNKKVSSSILTLKVYDVDDPLNPLLEETVKNNTLIERDFDF